MQINLGFEHYKHIKNVLFAFKFQLYITAHSFPRYAHSRLRQGIHRQHCRNTMKSLLISVLTSLEIVITMECIKEADAAPCERRTINKQHNQYGKNTDSQTESVNAPRYNSLISNNSWFDHVLSL